MHPWLRATPTERADSRTLLTFPLCERSALLWPDSAHRQTATRSHWRVWEQRGGMEWASAAPTVALPGNLLFILKLNRDAFKAFHKPHSRLGNQALLPLLSCWPKSPLLFLLLLHEQSRLSRDWRSTSPRHCEDSLHRGLPAKFQVFPSHGARESGVLCYIKPHVCSTNL